LIQVVAYDERWSGEDPAQTIQKKELMAKLTAMQAQLGDSLKLDQ
jgi:hypothetical protein